MKNLILMMLLVPAVSSAEEVDCHENPMRCLYLAHEEEADARRKAYDMQEAARFKEVLDRDAASGRKCFTVENVITYLSVTPHPEDAPCTYTFDVGIVLQKIHGGYLIYDRLRDSMDNSEYADAAYPKVAYVKTKKKLASRSRFTERLEWTGYYTYTAIDGFKSKVVAFKVYGE